MRRTSGWMPIILVLGTALAGRVAPAAAAQEGQDSTAEAARAVLEDALLALGPQQAADDLAGLILKGSGTATSIGQGRSPSDPTGTNPLTIEWMLDFRRDRALRRRAIYQGDLPYFAFTARYSPDETYQVEDVTGVLFPFPPAAAERSRAAALRRFPEPRGRVVTALDRSTTLVSRERRVMDGVSVDVVDARLEGGTRLRFYLDSASHLVRRIELGDPVHMLLDTLTYSIEYDEYRTIAGLQMPSWVRETSPNGTSIGSVSIDEYRYDIMTAVASIDDTMFTFPRMASPRQADGKPTLREVAPGVVFIENARPNYNQLAVEFDDYLLVVDAPFNLEVTGVVLELLAVRFPGKPVRYIVPTHFHYDHIGGLPGYVQTGARIVTTEDNVDFFRDIVTRAFASTLETAPKAEIEVVRDSLAIADSRQAVVLYAIQPTEHVDHMILVSVPAARLLYVADLVSADWGRLRPAIPETVQFADVIARLGIAAELYLPGHGPLVNQAGLEWALEEGRRMQDEP